jgi:hypothetical protein
MLLLSEGKAVAVGVEETAEIQSCGPSGDRRIPDKDLEGSAFSMAQAEAFLDHAGRE